MGHWLSLIIQRLLVGLFRLYYSIVLLAAVPLALERSVFKEVEMVNKNSLKPSQGLN